MKIAMISDALMTGGAERQLLLAAAELQRLGHHVKVVTYYSHVEFQDFIRLNNIDVFEIREKGFLRLSRVMALAKYFHQERFDVVHSFKGTATIFSSLAAKLAGIGPIFGGFRSAYHEPRIFRLAHRIVDRLLSGWIVNSRNIADSMIADLGINPKKVFVVYNGIYPDVFKSNLSKIAARQKLGLSEHQPVVTIVARLAPVKNHRLFLSMASVLIKRSPDVRFLIVGDGPLRKVLQEQAKSLDIVNHIFFLGSRTDIPDILAATDVSVLTSNSEGFPNTLIEAMSVGIPVVSTDYPGIEQLIVNGKQGFIVPRDDAESMAASVTRLLNDHKLRKQMGQEGMKMVQERLSPATMARNLVSVYKHFSCKTQTLTW